MAKINIYGEIGTTITASSFSNELAKIKNKSEDLDIYLDSEGGSVTTGWAITNMIKRWKGKTRVIVDGIAASIASLIAISANQTDMTEGSLLFIHDPYITAKLTGESAETIAKTNAPKLKDMKQQLINAYAKKTKLPASKLSELMSKETIFTAKEALASKFADNIIEGNAVAKLQTKEFTNSQLNNDTIIKLRHAIQSQIDSTLKGKLMPTEEEKKVEENVEEAKDQKVDTSVDLTSLTPEEVLAYGQSCQTYIDELEMKLAELADGEEVVEEAKKENEDEVKAKLINDLFIDELIGRAQAKVLNNKSIAFVKSQNELIRSKPVVIKKQTLIVSEPIAKNVGSELTMSASEFNSFKAKFGYEPIGFKVL